MEHLKKMGAFAGLLVLLSLSACKYEKPAPFRCGCPYPEVNKTVFMPASGDSVKVVFPEEGWWIWALEWKGEFKRVDNDTLRNHYRFDFRRDGFRLYRPNPRDLWIYMTKNTGNQSRRLGVYVENGNCHHLVTVIQQAP